MPGTEESREPGGGTYATDAVVSSGQSFLLNTSSHVVLDIDGLSSADLTKERTSKSFTVNA